MERNRRSASSLQIMTVIAVSFLFMFTALFGLYKCFSRVPEVEDQPIQSGTTTEPAIATRSLRWLLALPICPA